MIIMTDQQRADFFKDQGFGLDTMPFLESLRNRGVWFPSAYTCMPICTPARISMMTGRYARAHGMIANWPQPEPRFGEDLASVFRQQGYELALFGKNHSHLKRGDFDTWQEYYHEGANPRPGKEALDSAFNDWIIELGAWVAKEPTPFPLECQYPVRIVDDALQWLNQPREQPWFAWVSFPEPHSPVQAPEPYYSLFPLQQVPPPASGVEALDNKNIQWRHHYETIRHYHPEIDTLGLRYRAAYCGMLRLIDDQVERLVSFMDSRGMLENTLVVFLSDHGEFCGDYGLFRKGLALPQCCIRIPMFWFGGPVQPYPGCDHPAHVSIADVFPTFCEAAGSSIPAGVQARSLLPLLKGEDYSQAEFSSAFTELGVGGKVLGKGDSLSYGDKADTFFVKGVARTNFDGTRMATSGYRRAVVKGDWKLVYDLELPLEMYHLKTDPHELRNLAQDPALAPIRQDLLNELLYWCVRLDDNLDVRRYTPKMPPHNWYR
jgi:arylsulfatase A-like enzyme